MNKQIKAIIFDAGRVLVNFDNAPFFNGLASFSTYSEEEIKSKLKESGIIQKYHDGKINTQEFYEEATTKINASGLDFENFHNLWRSIITTPNKDIEKILNSIRPEIKLLILSDTTKPHWEIINGFDSVKKFFPDKNQAILSFEVKVSKPSAEIYWEAVKKASCPIEECVFIDDHKENVEEFRNLGGNGITYDCRVDSIDDLKNRLIKYNVFK